MAAVEKSSLLSGWERSLCKTSGRAHDPGDEIAAARLNAEQ